MTHVWTAWDPHLCVVVFMAVLSMVLVCSKKPTLELIGAFMGLAASATYFLSLFNIL